MIAEIFDLNPKFALEYAKNLPKLPEGAEGWFAILSLDVWPYFAPEYCKKLLRTLQEFEFFRPFCNIRASGMFVKLRFDTLCGLEGVHEKQKGDIWIVAAQLGARYRGRSVHEFHHIYSSKNEYGLPSFAVGSILLTHPERFSGNDDLSIDCAGDDFSPDGDGQYPASPAFDFCDGVVRFFVCNRYTRGKNSGSASFFV